MSQTTPLHDPIADHLVALLRDRAERFPDRQGYVFLDDGEREGATLTYAELDRRARSIAVALEPFDVAGQPVLVCAPPGLDYVASFFGSLYAGAIAVPANPPDPVRLERTVPRLKSILEDAGAVAALSTGGLLEAVEAVIDERLPLASDRWIAVDRLDDTHADAWREPTVESDDVAFLMYTSGSTAEPKGAVIPHVSALHNLRQFPGFFGRKPEVFVSWLPFFHDLGLFLGILHPLYRASLAVLMSPIAFIQRPARWLEAMSKYGATTIGGPNFALDLCVKRLDEEARAALDLSACNLVLNGSEPVRSDTLDRFSKAFAVAGFEHRAHYPSFGLAEATATVTGAYDHGPPLNLRVDRRALGRGKVQTTGDDDPLGCTLVGLGPLIGDETLAIVDPDRAVRCADDEVGEIWVAGPSIARGYWRRPDATGDGLRATLDGEDDKVFLRTGDLGFVYQDELFVAGRLKDLIILRGVNHHPEDLEHTVGHCHAALRPNCGAAFSVDALALADRVGGEATAAHSGAGGERLVIVQEVNPKAAPDLDAVLATVRQALTEAHDAEAHGVVLIAPRTLPKTSSGKIQRHRCARVFLDDGLRVVASWFRDSSEEPHGTATTASAATTSAATADAPTAGTATTTVTTSAAPSARLVRQRLIRHFAERLGVAATEIDIRTPFSRFGLASIAAVELVHELETWLGLSLPPTLAWEHPTIERLARHLSERHDLPESLTVERDPREPIAIVGLSCRFPGAPDAEGFWRLLRDGVDAISEVPDDRWDAGQLHDPDPAAPGKLTSRFGGFLPDLDQFDAGFFGITPREATQVDPRQRLLLETAWEALEDGRIPADALRGSATGVFVAALANDYDHLVSEDPRRITAYTGPGTAETILANRLSYVFDLHGPSVTLNTACSGSLVALHLACQSLRSGESDLALVGGVNLVLMPKGSIFFAKAGALAPDGHCKTFDARANGIARGDGAGMLVLKPLSAAVADDDPIRAIIRGSAVNSDGRSNGIMAPNGRAQEALLRRAYAQAGVDPVHVDYVEAHGTGTRVGDPIEVEALGRVLGAGRKPERPCRLGSVKTNLGHLEAAAGVAGVIKTVLALEHQTLPANLHFEQANELIPFADLGLEVQTERTPWTRNGGPRRAGVSAFGFGGTNAHVVLEEAPRGPMAAAVADEAASNEAPEGTDEDASILALSAHDGTALAALAERLRSQAEGLESEDSTAPSLRDLCRSANRGRSHLAHRAALVASTPETLAEGLDALAAGQPHPTVARGERPVGEMPRRVFVFSGQGAHWPGMGRDLFDQEPVFRAALEDCDRRLRALGGGSVLELFEGEEAADGTAPSTRTVQLTVFALQVGLVALWRSWGIEPELVVGQSLGEVAAAYTAGALDLDDALRVVLERSQQMETVAGQGATAAIGLPRSEAELVLLGFGNQLAVAGTNSPTSSVVAGDPEALDRLLVALQERKVFARRLRGVDLAFHSPHMDPLVEPLVAALKDIRPRATRIPLISAVDGAVIPGERLDADYWGRHLRQPFLFAEATAQTLVEVQGEARTDGPETLFVEIGPHPVLAAPILETLRATGPGEGVVLPSLRRDTAARERLLQSLAELYVRGLPVRWSGVYPEAGRPVPLPHYPWQRERFWFEDDAPNGAPSRTSVQANDGRRPVGHPLLGPPRSLATQPRQTVWELDLDLELHPFLADHRIQGAVVFPGAAFLEMALGAATQTFGPAVALCRVHFERALILPDAGGRRLQLVLTEGEGEPTFQIASRPLPEGPGAWTVHVRGAVEPPVEGTTPTTQSYDLEAIRSRCDQTIPVGEHYAALEQRGMDFGPGFRPIEQIQRRDGEALAHLLLAASETHATLPANGHGAHGNGANGNGANGHGANGNGANGNGANGHGANGNGANGHAAKAHGANGNGNGNGHRATAHGANGNGNGNGHGANGHATPKKHSPTGYRAHPTLLDATFQLVSATLPKDPEGHDEDAYLPSSVDRLQVFEPTAVQGWSHATLGYPVGAEGDAGQRWADLALVDDQGRPQLVVDGLRFQRLGDARAREGELLFETTWEALPDASSTESAEGPWQVLADPADETLAQALVAALAALGAEATLATDEPSAEGHVVDLRPMAPADPEHDPLRQVETLCQGVLDTLRQDLAQPTAPRRWWVTRGALEVTSGDPGDPRQAALWGLGRVLAREHPESFGGLVDLPATTEDTLTTDALAERLAATLLASDGGPEVALRDGRRWVARLEPYRPGPDARPGLPTPAADSTTLITGGLGDLGRATARWLVERGTRRFVLAGRTPLPARETWGTSDDPKVVDVLALERLGAEVHTVALDVADADAVAAFLADWQAQGRAPIRGVVHTAGVLADRLLHDLDPERLRRVLAPKVAGGWNLHHQLADLNFFVVFGSLASQMPPLGQGAYAAANAFLDALARQRRAQGQPAVSIAWGPFAELGMAARGDLEAQHRQGGIEPLSLEQGLSLLDRLADAAPAQVAAVAADWHRVVAAGGVATAGSTASGLAGLLSRLTAEPTAGAHGGGANGSGSNGSNGSGNGTGTASEEASAFLYELLLQPDREARRTLVRERLLEHTARIMRFDPARLDPRQPLTDLGIDSIMAVELSQRVESELGLQLTLMDLLKGASLSELAAQLLEQTEMATQEADLDAELLAMAGILDEVEAEGLGELGEGTGSTEVTG